MCYVLFGRPCKDPRFVGPDKWPFTCAYFSRCDTMLRRNHARDFPMGASCGDFINVTADTTAVPDASKPPRPKVTLPWAPKDNSRPLQMRQPPLQQCHLSSCA